MVSQKFLLEWNGYKIKIRHTKNIFFSTGKLNHDTNKLTLIDSKPDKSTYMVNFFACNKNVKNPPLFFESVHKLVNYKHFKMEPINNVINVSNVYMASIDLKNPIFSVNSQRSSKISWVENLFQFTSIPNGYMDLLWEYFLKYQKYLMDIWEAKVSQLSCICRLFISPRRHISILSC